MAIEPLFQYPAATSDMTSLQACSDLLRPTGHPASVSTLRRWIRAHGLRTERFDRTDYVSYSDILEVHRDEVLKRGGHL
ncbi:hypothetical protein [Streptomyces capuensis]|uniref:hypothetical protein n=1 Tax=Streptomyces capuensis TaxID=1464056 RepID=UPI0004BEF3B4|nr:hypothetical protein [Streptomyces capuensis]